jgi:predicted phosphodiesterase
MRNCRRLVAFFILFLFSFSISSFAFGGLKNDITTPEAGFSFIVVGDSQDGDDIFKDIIKKINEEKDISFVIHMGDFTDYGTESDYIGYLEQIKDLKVPIYHVIGNHDAYRGGWKNFEKYFGPTYYSFDHMNSHFVCLDNSLNKSFDEKQYKFFLNDLKNNKKKYTFVFMHKPLFDSSDLFEGYLMSNREIVKQLRQDFKRYKVNYAIFGHMHGYLRSEEDGTVYLITGGGGSPLHLPPAFGGFYHYVKITIKDDKIVEKVVRINESYKRKK